MTPGSRPGAAPASRWGRRVVGPFTLRHLLALAALLVGTAGLLLLLTTPLGSPPVMPAVTPGSGFYQTREQTTGLAVGQLAPELSGEVDGDTAELLDLDGAVVRLADLRGRPVWLSFFATWCPPCQEETPVLRDVHRRYRDQGLELIAVSVQETTPEDVAAWAATYDIPYTIGFDGSGAIFETYRGFGLPTHVLIDADGIIRHLRYGPVDRETADELVQPLLARPAG